MAIGDITVFQNHKRRRANGQSRFDFDAGAVKVALMKNTWTPSHTLTFWSNIITNQIATGAGYAGPAPLVGSTLTAAAGVVKFDANDTTVATQDAAGFANARWAVLFHDTGTPSTSELIAWIDLGGNVGNVQGPVQLRWNAAGILTW